MEGLADMLLNGWKEIAAYLKCGIRTAQRWHRDFHLPVVRVRSGKRGPVMADSENLKKWMDHRSSGVAADNAQQRSSAIVERTTQEGSTVMWLELETGRSFARLARTSKHSSATVRRLQAARKAYDALQRHLSRNTPLPKSELNNFREELREFRRELEQLGEVSDT